jgi:hypothetical protein
MGRNTHARRDVAELIVPLPGGLTAYRPTLRYHLLDEGRVQSLAADNTVADLMDIESARGREQMQSVVGRLSRRLAGSQNTGQVARLHPLLQVPSGLRRPRPMRASLRQRTGQR